MRYNDRLVVQDISILNVCFKQAPNFYFLLYYILLIPFPKPVTFKSQQGLTYLLLKYLIEKC